MSDDRNSVLNPAAGKYVMPAPPRTQAPLVLESEGHESALLLHSAAVSRMLGERFHVQAESLHVLLAEMRDRLERLDGAMADDSRAQLKGAVRELVRVVDWCDSLQGELALESTRAASGLEPIDLVWLCQQQAAKLEGPTDPISVVVHRDVTCWGERALLAHLVQKALSLVWARTGGRGMRCLELECRDGVPSLHICSRGEPVAEIDPDVVDRFRAAADKAGVTVVPDMLGTGGAGFVMRFPA